MLKSHVRKLKRKGAVQHFPTEPMSCLVHVDCTDDCEVRRQDDVAPQGILSAERAGEKATRNEAARLRRATILNPAQDLGEIVFDTRKIHLIDDADEMTIGILECPA